MTKFKFLTIWNNTCFGFLTFEIHSAFGIWTLTLMIFIFLFAVWYNRASGPAGSGRIRPSPRYTLKSPEHFELPRFSPSHPVLPGLWSHRIQWICNLSAKETLSPFCSRVRWVSNKSWSLLLPWSLLLSILKSKEWISHTYINTNPI